MENSSKQTNIFGSSIFYNCRKYKQLQIQAENVQEFLTI